jgi:predicted nucleic acid-binding protein
MKALKTSWPGDANRDGRNVKCPPLWSIVTSLSYLHKKDSRARLFRPHLVGRDWVLSFMSLAELDEWAEQHQRGQPRRERMERDLARFVVYYADRHLCRLWAEVRAGAKGKGRPIDKADAWIAATALALGVELVTHNPGDYAGVEGLRLLTAAAK